MATDTQAQLPIKDDPIMPTTFAPPRHEGANPRRRALLGAALGATALTACGGGTGDAPAGSPTITSFNADRARHAVGERATLTAVFSGGNGRIDGIGAVTSGVPVTTPVLTADTTFRLQVTGTSGSVARPLAIAVDFRDRYVVAGTLTSSQHATTVAADGSVLVIGGSRGLNSLSESIDRFDPTTRTLTRVGSLRTGRGQHTATRLPDGRVLVLGGATGVQIGNVADLVDERSGAVADGGALRGPRARHAATLLADGRVLVSGSLSANFGHTAEVWDPATTSFRLLPATMAHGRQGHTATRLDDGRVLIVGGYSEAANYRFAELWDPRSERFEPVATPITERRYLHAAHRLADGSVLIVGGEAATDSGTQILATTWRFDPGSARFTAQAALGTARTLSRSVALPDDRVLLVGGQVALDRHDGGGELYRPAGGGRALQAAAGERAWHSVDRLPDGRILVIGGEAADGTYRSDVLIYE
jgi:hypothetical protein